jgi:hypothetical protein
MLGLWHAAQLILLLTAAPLTLFLIVRNLHPCSDGAHLVQATDARAGDAGGTFNLGKVDWLVRAEAVHGWAASVHFREVLDTRRWVVPQYLLGDEIKVVHREPAACSDVSLYDHKSIVCLITPLQNCFRYRSDRPSQGVIAFSNGGG